MTDYSFEGAADIDRAIEYLVGLDDMQTNARAVLEIDDAITELQGEYEKCTANVT